ncbi:Cilia- and flagella-associated protein [Schistosoma japonicum]|uniref:Cilia-and flagella-associated protein n=1 Tax=Schistosoma japonicum TaxID=6182 RepID=A0A4Z2DNN5_SCHJA|nr:Cilia- and flagella-associated protein [Schistosoma japonicum]
MEKTDESFEIRRSNLTDVTQIEKLKNKVNLKGFGKKSLVKLIEKSVLSLCVTDNEKVIVGAACFYEYPNASQFPENDWIPRFSSTYCIQNVTHINSLFIHFLVISPAYEKLVTNQLLKAAFTIAGFVHYIFVLLEDVHNIKCLNFSPFHKLPKGCADANDIFCAYRHEIFPVLYCRPAMVEDTDDITPILNDLSTHLRTTYGDYYIAELVEAQSDNLKCFVVEYDRRAVGFVSATRNLNLIKLNEYYDLDVFDGLVKNDKLIKDRSQQGDKFAATGAQNEAEVTDNIMDGNETTSTYAGNKEHIGLVDLNHSNYLSVNEITDQVYHHWTKRLLYKNHTVKDTSNIMLDVKKPNAFAIQLFIMKSEYESRYMDMLPLVFSQFTDLEYAVISVPRSVKCFPMLKSFVHCRIRLNKDPEHELYVLHRSELHRDFTVRRTRHADEEGIKLLIEKMNIFDRSLLLADLQAFIRNGRDEDGTIISSYVFVALNKIVGVAILRDEHDIEWLRAHYNIEDFIYFAHHGRNEHASLYHFMLAANFQSRTEIFLREILRQSKKTCIYYRVLPPYAPDSKFNRCTLITCLSRLCPVKPRKQIIYPESLINSVKAPEKRILEKFNTMSALFMTTGKLLMEPKEIINARIIVVGASTTGLAVLETLVTCPYIRFNNLVLLSSNDLPGDTLHPVNPLFYKFLPTDYAYPVDYLSQLGLKVCVNTIHGKLTAIDRKFKRITVSSGQKLSYDYLIITTGLQYHIANSDY